MNPDFFDHGADADNPTYSLACGYDRDHWFHKTCKGMNYDIDPSVDYDCACPCHADLVKEWEPVFWTP